MAHRIAIVCPGPSLAQCNHPEWFADYAQVIAVNRAVTAVRADWWAALDSQTVDRFQWNAMRAPERLGLERRERPRLFYSLQMPRAWREANADLLRDGLPLEDASRVWGPGAHEPPPGVSMFTMLSAIVLAVYLRTQSHLRKFNVESIDLWGADLAGETDFTGDVGGNRGADRWNAERGRLEMLLEWAAVKCPGVEVRRCPVKPDVWG